MAFVLFAIYIVQIRDQPFAKFLVANPLVYDHEARQIVAGVAPAQPFFLSALYPAMVAVAYAASGSSLLAVWLVQGALLAANVWLIGAIAARVFSARVGLVASLITVFYWSFYYFAGEAVPATLSLTFMLTGVLVFVDGDEAGLSASTKRAAGCSAGLAAILMLARASPAIRNPGKMSEGGPGVGYPYGGLLAALAVFVLGGALAFLLLRRERARRLGRPFLSGTLLGMSTLVWSGSSVLAVMLAGRFLASGPRRLTRSRLAVAAVFAAGFGLPVAASLVYNYSVSHEVIPITASFGVNLFIGNNPASDGTDPFRFGEGNRVRIEADKLGLAGKRRSDFFAARALEFVRTEPEAWLRLLARKFVVSLSRVRVNNNADMAERRAAWKWFALPVLGFGVVFPLAATGAARGLRGRAAVGLLLVGYVSFVIVGLATFVCERFRLPAIAFLIPLAAYGAEGLVKDALGRRWKNLTLPALAFTAAALVSNIDFLRIAGTEFPSITANKAYVARLAGDHEEAGRLAEAAIRRDPQNAPAYFQLAAIEEFRGNKTRALDLYLESLEHDPFFVASYAAARQMLDGARISAAYLDAYLDAVLDGRDYVGKRGQMVGFLGARP